MNNEISRCVISVLLLTLQWGLQGVSSQKFDSIKITVYYDAAGNASADFLTNQVLPSYPVVGDRITLSLVPFCLAAMQPGSDSYRANVIHACGFCQSTDQQVHLDFAVCAMSSGPAITEENVRKCAAASDLSFDHLMECAKGAEGRARIANNGYATRAVFPPIYQLPSIANNGWVNAALQTRAKTDFLGYVCAFLNNAPSKCARAAN